MLEVEVKNPFFFRAKATQEVIPRGTTRMAPIPQQFSAGQAESLDNLMAVARIGTKTTVGSTVVTLLITGSLSEVWGMINSVQMLAYIRHMDLYMPANTEAYFDFMLTVADFEIVDPVPVYDRVYNWVVILDPKG